jgi:uncharacterized protein YfaA (DUF2138 family)
MRALYTQFVSALVVTVAVLALAPAASAQQNSLPAGSTQVAAGPALPYTTPISTTAAVNNQVTLTIPAPAPGLYNYICGLRFEASQDGTATAAVNSVTTSTNFNAFALKYSLAATADAVFTMDFNWGTPTTGCVKSTLPATATTFVSPSAAANTAFSWYATYYQGY